MKEKSRVQTLLWLLFPLWLVIAVSRFYLSYQSHHNPTYLPMILSVSAGLVLSFLYFCTRKKAVGRIGVAAAFLSVLGVFIGKSVSPTDMHSIANSSLIVRIPGIYRLLHKLIQVFTDKGNWVAELAYAFALFVLPGLFLLVFYLRTGRCKKVIDLEAAKQNAMEKRQTQLAQRRQTSARASVAPARQTRPVPTPKAPARPMTLAEMKAAKAAKASAPAAQSPREQAMEKLKKLQSLHNSGILSEEEFTAKKAEILKTL